MNLSITGLPIFDVHDQPYANTSRQKYSRVTRHFDHVIDTQVMLSVEPLKHRAEITMHVRGKDIHCEALEENLYAAIDVLIDKVDRKVIQYKTRTQNHSHVPVKRQVFESA